MSLINCPECNKEISDKAYSCPNCGYPIAASQKQEFLKEIESTKREAAAEVLCNEQTEKPKKHKKHTFLKIVLSIVIIISLLGIAFVPLYFLDPFGWFSNKNMTEYEEMAVSCIREDLRVRLKDRTSLRLTDNIRVLKYGGYYDIPYDITLVTENGIGWYYYLEIPYSATNSYGGRIENTAYYHIQFNSDGYVCTYAGSYSDLLEFDMYNTQEYSHAFLQFYTCNWNLDGRHLDYDEAELLNTDKIANFADCEYTP